MIQDSNERAFAIVGIGSSAGGPATLERLFARLANDLPAAFLLSQHMPMGFTRSLAERLSSVSKWPAKEAHHGCVAKAAEVLIAPGGYNMEISRRGIVRLERAPDIVIPTPSINVMMKSIARAYGPKSVGVLLTGMLSDGVNGMKAIKDRGGVTIAQDEASSLVYGMPKAAVDAGVVDLVANIVDMPARIANAVETVVARSSAIERDHISR
jgi:two-component system chemotaxis response regulator CheB